MKSINILSLTLISLLSFCCIRKHTHTSKVCDRFYVEIFNINPAGVYEEYLTDSINFKIYVGKYDVEHERTSYSCSGDSIKIVKRVTEISGTGMKGVDSVTISVLDLVEKKRLFKEPLLEFR